MIITRMQHVPPEAATEAVPVATAQRPSVVLQVLEVAGRALRERWRSLLVWSLGLVGITAIELAVYPSIQATSQGWQAMLDQWPDALKEAFRLDAYASGPGFLNTELFSMMFPIVLIAVALGAAASATAGEEERGTADLLLSLPVSRGAVLLGKVLAMLVSVLGVTLAGVLTILVGAPLVDLSVDASGVLAAGITVARLAVVFGCIGLLLGALTGRRAAALGGGIGLAIAAFLLQVLAPMADWLEPWKDLSPFTWALDSQPLINGIDVGDTALLLGTSAVLLLVTAVVLHRRDISGR